MAVGATQVGALVQDAMEFLKVLEHALKTDFPHEKLAALRQCALRRLRRRCVTCQPPALIAGQFFSAHRRLPGPQRWPAAIVVVGKMAAWTARTGAITCGSPELELADRSDDRLGSIGDLFAAVNPLPQGPALGPRGTLSTVRDDPEGSLRHLSYACWMSLRGKQSSHHCSRRAKLI